MINTESQMVDLLEEEEFGPFEGSMFIGGATTELQKKSSLKQGLIGCFRGLVVNGEILDIYSYMSVHLSEIIKDCKPSCVNSPCKNGAKCKELWSTFQCMCVNPWAHIGEFCETSKFYFNKNLLLIFNVAITSRHQRESVDFHQSRIISKEKLLGNKSGG